jgi:hypothetical protein
MKTVIIIQILKYQKWIKVQHLQGECPSGVLFLFLKAQDFVGVALLSVSLLNLLGVLLICPLFIHPSFLCDFERDG